MAYTTAVTSLQAQEPEWDLLPVADFKIFDAAFNWTSQFKAYPTQAGFADLTDPLSHPATVPGTADHVFLQRIN